MNTIMKQHNLCLIYLLGLAILVSVSSFEMDDEQEMPVIHSISKNHRRQHSLHHSSRGPNLTKVKYIGGPLKELRINSIKDGPRYRQRSHSEDDFLNLEKDLQKNCSQRPVSRFLTYGDDAGPFFSRPYVTVIIQSEDKSYQHSCGGTLLSDRHILTAVSCIKIDRPRVLVAPLRKKVNGIVVFHIAHHATKFTDDPNSPHFRDLIVLRLAEPLKLNRTVGSACLPTKPFKCSDRAYQLGFGIIDQQTNEIPEKLKMWTVRKDICPKELSPFPTNICFSHQVVEEMGNVCEGDMGSGLLTQMLGKLTISGVLSKPSGPCIRGTFGYGIAIDAFVHKRGILGLILGTDRQALEQERQKENNRQE